MDIKKMTEWLESDEGKSELDKYLEELAEIKKVLAVRHRRFEKWLEDNDFDELMNRLILEHDDNYIEKCYHKGYEPSPNRKLSFIIGYVINNLSPICVTELNCDFPNQIWQFSGYYFQHIYGQGTIFRLYKKDCNELILQL